MARKNRPPVTQGPSRGEVFMDRPHVVILGAGASTAALPDGDANGRYLPLMANFLEVVPSIKALLVDAGLELDYEDFESAYANVARYSTYAALTSSIETAIHDYFHLLRLPPVPTIYDHLVLALREKDVIATFNWDPLLLQAAQRSSLPDVSLPRLLFLHGNVLSGYCATDSVHGYRGARCSRCGSEFHPSRLLYPIADKDYRSDPTIESAWNYLQHKLQDAFMVTIFGYSAPTSDASAIDLLRKAWDRNEQEDMNQFEVIDIQDEKSIRRTWSHFIHFDHYEVHSSFYDSWLAKHPRRTGEAYIKQYYDAEFIRDNTIPQNLDLPDTQLWYRELVHLEENAR